MKRVNTEKAITLIALILTIIVLLILAGISLSLIKGKTKILDNAKMAKRQAKIGELQEVLDVGKTDYIIGDYDKGVSIDKFMDYLDEKDIIDKTTDVDLVEGNENARYVTMEKEYVFLVEIESEQIKNKYMGTVEELKPVITIKEISNTTNKIDLKIETKRNINGNLQYWFKKDGEENYQLIKEGVNENTKNCEFIDLDQNTKYYIKVVAANKNNIKSELEIDRKTAEIPNLSAYGNIKFACKPSEWTNTDVTATAQTDITGFTLQTSKDSKKWENIVSQTYSSNGTVYARLWDGRNYGGSASASFTNIDKEKPVITEVTSTTNSISIKATDDVSGIIGYAVTTTNKEPSEFITIENTKSFSTTLTGRLQGTTYYVWVKDQAGNISDSKYTITKNVNGLTEGNTTFIYSTSDGIIDKNTWTNKDVTVTAKTTVEGFTLKTSKNGTNWDVKDNQLYTSNGIMYAILYDGTNYGGSATANVTNIDKEMPTATITMNSVSTCVDTNITATVAMNDKQSGINLSKCKWVYNTTSSKIGTTESLYTGGTFSSKSQNINLRVTTAGTYYLHILIADNAGNIQEIIADKSVAVTDHSYTSSTVSASCTSGGYIRHTCSKCGTSYTDSYTSSLGHSYYTYSSSSASCTSSGYTTYRCSRCGDTYSVTTGSATGHDYKSTVTKATCTTGGYTTHTCSKCGDSYKDSETESPGHNWGSWSTTKAATCTTDGTKKRTCSRCGKSQTATIESVGHHTWVAATCTKPKTCSKCGATSGSATGHSWGSWSTTKSATCTSTGTKKRTCSKCGKSDTDTIAAKGHSYSSATCTSAKKCSRCGATSGSALGHNWGSWSTTSSPTCTSSGSKKRSCSRCGASRTSTISALGHNWVTDKTHKNASKCTRCGKIQYTQ